MKLEDSLTATIGANLKPSAADGEGIGPYGPRAIGGWQRSDAAVITVVEDQLEPPRRWQKIRNWIWRPIGEVGCRVGIANVFDVALDLSFRVGPIAFMNARSVDPGVVFANVAVEDDIALVIEGFSNQVSKGAPRVFGICDSTGVVEPVERGDVARGDRSPMRDSGADCAPALYPREETFDTGPVRPYFVFDSVPDPLTARPLKTGIESRDEVLRPR